MVNQAQEVLGVVLAGGQGARFGQPKAMARLGHRALIEYPLLAMCSAGLDTVVVAKPESLLPALDAPIWQEPPKPSHPLLGIATALGRSEGRPVMVCACDMPFVTPELIQHIAGGSEALMLPRYGGRLHPLLARYDAELLDELLEALAAQRSMHATVESLGPSIIDEQELLGFGDPKRLLFNVNTPEDLATAERMLTQ